MQFRGSLLPATNLGHVHGQPDVDIPESEAQQHTEVWLEIDREWELQAIRREGLVLVSNERCLFPTRQLLH